MAADQATTQNWWQTLPGILTATAGCISAITALIIALHQAGVFDSHDEMSSPAATPSRVLPAPPTANATQTVAPVGTGKHALAPDAKTLLKELERANVRYSVDNATMLNWLADSDRTFRRIAQASLRLLDGKRVKGNPPDLDVIKYRYLERVGQDGGGQLAADADIDEAKLQQAIIAAFNDKNGSGVHRFEGITEAR